MPNWRLGTMGFSYAEWAGAFYRAGMKPGEYLGHYAKHFGAVELDTTFHAVPPPDRVRRWGEATPDDFRFCVKAPRAVTHDLPLERSVQPMLQFIETMRGLGEKLAVVLLQFPPSFTLSQIGAFDKFLSEMPGDIDFASEFRDDSWLGEQTAHVLAKHQVAWASADYVGEKAQIVPTADFLYIRWIGQHNRFRAKNLEEIDPTDRLLWWKEQIDLACGSIQTIWGFFNNDYAGYSIATCNRFKRLIGLPVIPTSDVRQGRLF
jgi:uncharacterized protein YecE (DUF72 family)